MKLLYIHNTVISSKKANLVQVLSMCNAFVENKIDIELALPKPFNHIENINEYINNRFGINSIAPNAFFPITATCISCPPT